MKGLAGARFFGALAVIARRATSASAAVVPRFSSSASADDASAWFAGYTAREKPGCRPVTFVGADSACDQSGPARGGTYPLFRVVQDQYVVWIHLIQKKLDLNVLRTLASDVLAHATTA